jgi:hypothetical protein
LLAKLLLLLLLLLLTKALLPKANDGGSGPVSRSSASFANLAVSACAAAVSLSTNSSNRFAANDSAPELAWEV